MAAVVLKRMRGDDWEREAALSAALDEVLADTLDDLRAEQDPRRAVIRAFARMEKTFAAHGVAREPAETPRQYVVRALDTLGVSSASVQQLTKLYERAKFSRLEIDEGDEGRRDRRPRRPARRAGARGGAGGVRRLLRRLALPGGAPVRGAPLRAAARARPVRARARRLHPGRSARWRCFNIVLAAGEAFPREERSALAEALDRDAPEAQRPAELDRLERELTMANASAFDTHVRLRPVVREIVGVRLGARGLRLEDSEEVLGPELWELARDERPAPTDRHAPGTPAATLRRMVERLETL